MTCTLAYEVIQPVSPPPYMVLPYLLPPFKCNKPFHLKMKGCCFCKVPLLQNRGALLSCWVRGENSLKISSSAGLEDASTLLIRGGRDYKKARGPLCEGGSHYPFPLLWAWPHWQMGVFRRCNLALRPRLLQSRPTRGRRTQKPHLRVFHCLNFLKIENRKKTTANLATAWNGSGLWERGETGHICGAGECERWCHAWKPYTVNAFPDEQKTPSYIIWVRRWRWKDLQAPLHKSTHTGDICSQTDMPTGSCRVKLGLSFWFGATNSSPSC